MIAVVVTSAEDDPAASWIGNAEWRMGRMGRKRTRRRH